MKNENHLKKRIAAGEMIVAPGVYDCVTARLVEQAGYDAAYMTGAGTAATLGFPDYGLVVMTEMADNAARICTSVSIPIIADADTGFGNELNVTRTVREYARAGVSAVHIEDQEFPKKCGHLDDKRVIPLDEFLPKIRAAAAVGASEDVLIIARTDARATLGLDEAVRRANAALDAGADVAFVEAPVSIEEVAAIPQLVRGPCLLNIVWKGKTPDVAFEEARTMGYRMAILPGLLLAGVMEACEAVLEETARRGRHAALSPNLSVNEIFRRMGAEEWDHLRGAFRPAP